MENLINNVSPDKTRTDPKQENTVIDPPIIKLEASMTILQLQQQKQRSSYGYLFVNSTLNQY